MFLLKCWYNLSSLQNCTTKPSPCKCKKIYIKIFKKKEDIFQVETKQVCKQKLFISTGFGIGKLWLSKGRSAAREHVFVLKEKSAARHHAVHWTKMFFKSISLRLMDVIDCSFYFTSIKRLKPIKIFYCLLKHPLR